MNKIILSSVLALFLVACSDQKSEHKQAVNEAKEAQSSVKTEVTEAKAAVESAVKETANEVKEAAAATELAKEKSAEAKDTVKEVVAPAVEKVPENIATVVDGKKLFAKCAGCHGMNADKKALGKSQVIKGWSVEKVETALKGYKDGTYGGASKSFMKAQVANLSDADIKALAEYISKL